MADLTSNLLLAARNWADGATLTVGSENAAFPKGNLQVQALSEVFRTASTDPALTKISWDLGAGNAPDINAIALVRHNLRSTAQWRILLDNTAIPDGTGDAYDSGLISIGTPGWKGRNLALHLRTIGSAPMRYGAVWLSDSGNPAGYLEAARLVVGVGAQMALNIAYGWEIGVVDPSRHQDTPGGHSAYRLLQPYRVLRCEFRHMVEAEAYDTLMEGMDARAGTTGDVLAVPTPLDSTRWHLQAIWGRQLDLSSTVAAYFRRWHRGFSVRERVT